MGGSGFSQSMFTDLCERMLRLCKLTPGREPDRALPRGGACRVCRRLPHRRAAPRRERDEPAAAVSRRRRRRARSACGRSARRRSPATAPAVEILKGADMVVETLFLLFSDELTEIQSAGTRILHVHRAGRPPRAHVPDGGADAAYRCGAGGAFRRGEAAVHEPCRHRRHLPDRLSVKAQYGYVERPGQWDHWPSGAWF